MYWNRAAIALFIALFSAPAAHANLLLNGGFETGDFTSWTVTNSDSVNSGVNTIAPFSGTYKAFFTNAPPLVTISQIVTTAAGQGYVLSFELANTGGGSPSEYTVNWNGTVLADVVNSDSFAYTLMSFDVLGTGSDTVTLGFSNTSAGGNGVFRLDDVQLNVPEPATTALLASGLLGLGIARRTVRRRGY